VFALHPLYINLARLTTDAALLKEIAEKQKELNELPQIDYEAVINYKTKTLKKIFETPAGKQVLQSKEFKTWFTESEYWLAPYALYLVFREKFGTSDWAQWGNLKHISRVGII
jgi:4-alpha-glucanotransferase